MRGQSGLVHRHSAVPWQWVIDEEADGVLYCTVQRTGTGRNTTEEHRGAHLIQPGEQVEPGVGEDVPAERELWRCGWAKREK